MQCSSYRETQRALKVQNAECVAPTVSDPKMDGSLPFHGHYRKTISSINDMSSPIIITAEGAH